MSSWTPFKRNADGSLDLHIQTHVARQEQGDHLDPGTGFAGTI